MRRWLWPACAYAATTALFTLPLLHRFGSAFPHDAGDPVLNTWLLWWSTRAVPLGATWWNAPMFYPAHDVMALSEVLIGLLPVSAPIQLLTGSPLVAYNTTFLLSFPLCALAAYLLGLELTGSAAAALTAGLAFAFAPYRATQLAHIQMLAYYGAPIALAALHAYRRTTRRRWLVLFALAWLVQSLSNGYAMFHLSVLVAMWLIWFARPLRTAVPVLVAWACAALPLIPLLATYERVHRSLHLVRDINEIKAFSVDLSGFFSASPDSMLWGARLLDARSEAAAFPGITVCILALVAAVRFGRRRLSAQRRGRSVKTGQAVALAVALIAAAVAASVPVVGPWQIGRVISVSGFHKPLSIAALALLIAWLLSDHFRRAWCDRSVTVFYAAAVVTMYLLALGPEPHAFGRPLLYEPPYAWLMRLPGFSVLRVPARFVMLAALCQSALIALAVARWRPLRMPRPALAIVVCVGLLLDGAFRLPLADPPEKAFSRWSDVAAIVELPPGRADVDFPALYRSMFHKHPIVNGFSGYNPPHYLPLRDALDDGEVQALCELAIDRRIGVAFNGGSPEGGTLAARLSTLSDAARVAAAPGWTTFTVGPCSHPQVVRLGPPLQIRRIEANRHAEDVTRMIDGTVESAWGSEPSQQGDEQVVVELDAPRAIGGVLLKMGAFAFGFPRTLSVEASIDGGQWSPVWQGATAALTVRAAIANPGDVPLTIPLHVDRARFVRLRQTRPDVRVPWWIAELEIRAPVTAAAPR